MCDPVGNIPIFVAALDDVAPERRARIILRECFIAFLVLSVAVFLGRPFLGALGLSDVSLQIGGAVVLMLVALALPAVDEAWLPAYSQGMFALADAHGCVLAGGDTTRSPQGVVHHHGHGRRSAGTGAAAVGRAAGR